MGQGAAAAEAIGAPLPAAVAALTLLAVAEVGRGAARPERAGAARRRRRRAARPRGVRDDPRLRRAPVPARRASRPARGVGGADRLAAGRRGLGWRPPSRRRSRRLQSRTRCCASSGRPDARARGRRRGSRSSRRCRRGTTQLRARGLRLAVVPWAPGELIARAKSTSYAENMAAQDEAGASGRRRRAVRRARTAIVLEAPTSNVWFREERRLFTPSLELPILAGVTRATLIELASDVGYGVEEGRFPLGRLLAADEAFLTLVDPRGDAGGRGRRTRRSATGGPVRPRSRSSALCDRPRATL